MGRATLDELALRLAIAKPLVGTLWMHKSHVVYRITGVSIRENDGDLLYSYHPLDFPQVTFTRPAWEWTGFAEGDSEPRFTRLED